MYYHNIQYFSSKKFTDAEKNNVFSTSVLLFMTLRLPYCAAATGYTDIKTLQRAFKRYEGITPGQYKEDKASK